MCPLPCLHPHPSLPPSRGKELLAGSVPRGGESSTDVRSVQEGVKVEASQVCGWWISGTSPSPSGRGDWNGALTLAPGGLQTRPYRPRIRRTRGVTPILTFPHQGGRVWRLLRRALRGRRLRSSRWGWRWCRAGCGVPGRATEAASGSAPSPWRGRPASARADPRPRVPTPRAAP